MTLWFLGFLFHVQHLIILIEDYDTCALQFFYGWLLMAHDARGLLLVGVINKLLETEVEDVVGGDDEEIRSPFLSSPLGEKPPPVLPLGGGNHSPSFGGVGEALYCQYQVADCAEAIFVGVSTVVDDADGFGVCLFGCPLLEDMGKLMVCYYDMFGNLWNAVDVIEHSTEYCCLANLEEWLWKILC